jgi:hypothetical protein
VNIFHFPHNPALFCAKRYKFIRRRLQLVYRFQNNIATFNTLYCDLISCHLSVSAPP